MDFHRPEVKKQAKAAMRGVCPSPMLVTLVYVLLTGVLTSVVTGLVSNPFQLGYWYYVSGESLSDIFYYVFTASRVGLYGVLQILISLYHCIMSFGYTAYCLRLARSDQAGYRTLMEGFSFVGRVVLTAILTDIFVALWSALAMIPFFVVLILSIVTGSELLVVLAVGLAIAGGIFGFAVAYRYRLANYFLLDHSEMGALEAIRQSKQAMRGWKAELFILDLSFLGWELLAPFTLGILYLWLKPYQGIAEVFFYNCVVGGQSTPRSQVPPLREDGGYRANYDGTGRPTDPF